MPRSFLVKKGKQEREEVKPSVTRPLTKDLRPFPVLGCFSRESDKEYIMRAPTKAFYHRFLSEQAREIEIARKFNQNLLETLASARECTVSKDDICFPATASKSCQAKSEPPSPPEPPKSPNRASVANKVPIHKSPKVAEGPEAAMPENESWCGFSTRYDITTQLKSNKVMLENREASRGMTQPSLSAAAPFTPLNQPQPVRLTNGMYTIKFIYSFVCLNFLIIKKRLYVLYLKTVIV